MAFPLSGYGNHSSPSSSVKRFASFSNPKRELSLAPATMFDSFAISRLPNVTPSLWYCCHFDYADKYTLCTRDRNTVSQGHVTGIV